jgi:hypothetical protein
VDNSSFLDSLNDIDIVFVLKIVDPLSRIIGGLFNYAMLLIGSLKQCVGKKI